MPEKSYTYDYDDSPLRVKLGDYELFTDVEAFHYDPEKKRKAGTDGAMVRQFLASKGYSYPTEVAYARMVYLTDASRQKELMIIFMDDLASYELTAAELNDGGANAARWPEIEQAHLDRITATLTMLPFIVTATIGGLASLDFLGFGLPSSAPSLGELTLQAKQNLQAPWLAALFVIPAASLAGIPPL